MDSEAESPDAILHLDSEIVEEGSSQDDGEREPMRHRMHRSAVRPFLCCGSEVSLLSLVDTQEDSSVEGSGEMLLSPKNGKLESAFTGCRRVRKRPEKIQQSKSKKKFWSLRGKLGGKFSGAQSRSDASQLSSNPLRKRNGCKSGSSVSAHQESSNLGRFLPGVRVNPNVCLPFINFGRVNFDVLYPTRDVDETRREERAREIEEGIDVSANQWSRRQTLGSVELSSDNPRNVVTVPPHRLLTGSVTFPVTLSTSASSDEFEDSIYGDTSVLCLQALAQHLPSVFQQTGRHPSAHSQVEYIHCLVPGLKDISKCSFYWGVMDRYEAETLLENKPEGTFLLRDSAQEDFLFSVSFRRYNRSLHARIEQWNHLFSFDAHDPAVFSCDSVVGLIEHYKDPECCMFFEPMLTLPLNRTTCFSLKHLCRSVICSNLKYDDVNQLPLPSSQKEYLKYYHYKQKVRTKRFDMPA